MTFKELDLVALTRDFNEYGLKSGDTGTILEKFTRPDEAFLVEFSDESGEAVCTEFFKSSDLKMSQKYRATHLYRQATM